MITVTGAGTYSIRDYVLSGKQRVNLYLKDLIEADLSGFYYVDSNTWTMHRVDFPPPPTSSNEGSTVFMQSGPTPTGPWSVFLETKVPTNHVQEYFRLRVIK